MCSRWFGWKSERSRLSCDEISFPRWNRLSEVAATVRTTSLRVFVMLASSFALLAGKRETVLGFVITRTVVALKMLVDPRIKFGLGVGQFVRSFRSIPGPAVVGDAVFCMFCNVVGSGLINKCDNVRFQIVAETFESPREGRCPEFQHFIAHFYRFDVGHEIGNQSVVEVGIIGFFHLSSINEALDERIEVT